MAKPIIKKLSAASFLDGSVVYENDARIGGEIAGNVEISDLSEPRSRYNITVGPVYYGPDSTVVTAGTSSWETPDVSALVFQAPRDMTITAMDAHLFNDINVDGSNAITVTVDKATALDGMSGAYTVPAGANWTPSATLVLSVDGSVSSGVYRTDPTSVSISSGEFVRVLLGGTAKTQGELTVTLQVVEDHAE